MGGALFSQLIRRLVVGAASVAAAYLPDMPVQSGPFARDAEKGEERAEKPFYPGLSGWRSLQEGTDDLRKPMVTGLF